ncbi:hypothetical protein MHYP_G00197160 [Metynnis hypsauchen]
MAASEFLRQERLLLTCFLFLAVYGRASGPYFMVMFPAVIESGSEATLCASLLKPNETLQMTIYLVYYHENRTLLQERVEEEFHRCSKFKAPQVEGESVQYIRVDVKGESFEMTEKRKVMFKSYNPLTFIQTDKPIYNPGQTVNFRVVTVDTNFVPLKQEIKENGCATPVFNMSHFAYKTHEWYLKDNLDATVTVTEEGTDFSMEKYVSIDITNDIGEAEFLDVPETLESDTIIEGKVMSKGAIVHHGYEKVEVKESKELIEGKVSFRLSVDAGLAPVVQVLVYCVLPSEKIIATTKKFNVEKCFRNKVSLQFSPTEAVPGEENTLQLSAQPGSLCGLSAVDQSVFIMEPRKRLNADEGVGIKVVSNLAERNRECFSYTDIPPRRYGKSGFISDRAGSRYSINAKSGPVSPETWIWQLAEVGDSGSAQVPVTVPDTITTWETEAFCLSSKGLGLASPAQLRVSQPFILELSLPYSIIRGEEFELKATVFNYLSKCIMVKVTPAPSSHYTLKASSDGEYSSCLCSSSKKTFKWTLVPSVLGVLNVTVSAEAEQSQTVCDKEIVSVPERGRIDTVTRSLLVQPEGTEKIKSQSWLLCPQGNNVSEEVELILPEDAIEGSTRASVSVLGDILGHALKNIDGLLKIPYGCREQNITLLAPNIYILQYLENTGQLTAAIRERATGFLKTEYQRQLNYKHVDGAYSTSGRGEGDTWLTAFVLKTFGKAQHYIFIDQQNIDSAKKWLISNQRPDGCFIRRGQMLNTNGGINDDMTITAYITASLLELGDEVQDPVVSKGLSCLKSSTGNLTNTYTTALLAYTFSLAGEHDVREQLLKKLDSVAISGDGRLHWSQSASDDSDSLSVEISSYVLLAVLTTAEVTAADLGYANRIVSWLVRQQNPYGGFSSTQDTVVALQALALYSTKVFSSDGSSTVTVQSADKESHHFDVNQDNKLLYQERPLQDVPGKYSISVKGSTCVSAQVALFYNIRTNSEPRTLSIEAKTDGNCTESFGYTLSINFTVTHFMVMFPAVIESGSEATLCTTLLKPNETLQMTIYLVHDNQNRTLLQERVEEEFHRCSQFKDNKGNRIGQWTNVSSPGLIVHLSHKLNPEAPEGQYKLKANIGFRSVTHHFKVKKYVLPRFEITVKTPVEQSVGEELKIEVCAKYTYGQPVPGKALVQVCRKFKRRFHQDAVLISPCLVETVKMKENGCASPVFNMTHFISSEFERHLKDSLDATVTVTEEGTDISMEKSESIKVTYVIGKVEFLDLPKNFERDKLLEGKVLSKGAIVHHGYEKVEVKESKKLIEGKVSFRLSVDAGLAPVVQVLVYCVLPSENVIAASKNFNVEKCFRNKVSLQFSPTEAVPGEENTLQLSAQPGSLCGLSAVDQSVFIMEPGKRLNADKGVGLKMATNLAVRLPDCLVYVTWKKARDERGSTDATGGFSAQISFDSPVLRQRTNEADHAVSGSIEAVRTFFPETWLWQLAEVGDSGSAQVPVTVPDTITTWEADAFCLSSEGLGVAPSAQLRVFQPFFLELSLPYSIIRGEMFELKATVFNYLSKCIMVKVTPAPSSHYTLKASSDGEYSSCLCANGRKTFKWTLVPSVLGVLNVTVSAEAEQSQTVCDNEIVSVPERGRIDTVTRSLLVQAEGTEKTKSQSWLLCPQGKMELHVCFTGNSVSEEMELVLPEDVIEGSARASVSVLGDILGRALQNIDGLLKMPYGCGEQNIALLAPNIYILQYLENTGQLTAAIRERATGFLKSGYQRQLNYKHFNGAYSTFGRGEGNTWLTAFVLRTFGKAQRYIFIDPQNIETTKKWLISNQRADGCFIRQGRLFNNRMKGGVNDDVTMTAYITASLLELGHKVKDPVVSKGLSCLKSSIGNLTNTYAAALLAYTFSLAGEHDVREQLLKKLDSVAISGDGRLHWSQSASDDSDSLSVEISSYVLLAVLTTAEVTAADLGYANKIVSWLVRQQNPYGGFSSTQDTVVALQSLALYSTKVFSSDGSSTVTVQSADKESHHFDVNQDNKLLYQERPLQDVPGKYSISVKGSTCMSVQVALFYNIPTPTESNTLSIEAKTDGNCTKSFGYTLSINFTVTYNGELNSTNMVIVDIKILSGFTADPSELKKRLLVERVDSKDDHVIMYMKEVPRNSPMNYQLHLKQVLPVKNLKPAVIKVYDYYQTSDQSETEYSSPCV